MSFLAENGVRACFERTLPSATLFDTKEMSAEISELLFTCIQRGVNCLQDALTDRRQSLLKLERLLVHQVDLFNAVDATLDDICESLPEENPERC